MPLEEAFHDREVNFRHTRNYSFSKSAQDTQSYFRSDSPPDSRIFIGEYSIENNEGLGIGAYSEVKLGHDLKTGERVAVKIIDKSKFNDYRNAFGEQQFLSSLDHPNIVKLHQVFEDTEYIFLVLEYIPGEDLYELVRKKKKFSERQAFRFFSQMLDAVDYCHRKNVSHRDLKLENMLLDADQNVVLIDFNLAERAYPPFLSSKFCGSPLYAPPELVLKTPYNPFAADVWSLGICLFVMLCGRFPFYSRSIKDLFGSVLKGKLKFPIGLSRNARFLLKGMLEMDSEKRMTIEEIRHSPWMMVNTLESEKEKLFDFPSAQTLNSSQAIPTYTFSRNHKSLVNKNPMARSSPSTPSVFSSFSSASAGVNIGIHVTRSVTLSSSAPSFTIPTQINQDQLKQPQSQPQPMPVLKHKSISNILSSHVIRRQSC